MKQQKEISKKAWRFTIVYAICLLILFSATVFILLQSLRQSKETKREGETKEIYVYLPQEDSTPESEAESDSEAEKKEEEYLVREYRGQIGVFSADGTLLEILDTYVKTLPEADRALLGEGISIKTKEELNSLIEDYSH